MLKNSLYARIVACAAGVAMMMPAMPVSAAPQAASNQARQGTDLVITQGKLNGKLLNANGKPVEGAVVTVAKNGKEVARTVTKTDGSYAVTGLSSGNHTISMADGQFPVRLWSKEAAPTAAKDQFTVAQTAVRGQYVDEFHNEILVIVAVVAVTALVVGFVALDEAQDNNNNQPASP
jgi:hypothetical protein